MTVCQPNCVVRDALFARRILITNEMRVQIDVGRAFAAAGLDFTSEVDLGNGRIDFLVRAGDERIGVEIKIKGSARDVHRQLARYVKTDQIDRLVLVTSHAHRMPDEIDGKSITVFSLSEQWL